MKKQALLFFLITFSFQTFSQDWEKTTDFIGLDAYCSLGATFIGTSNGIISFSTYNNEWKRIGLKDKKVYSLYHDWAGAKDTIIAGTDKGIYFSPDKGATWHSTNAPLLKYNNVNLMKLYTDNRVLYASSDEGVYYAANNLSDWKYFALANYKVNKYVGLVADTVRIFACDTGLIFTGEKYGVRNKTSVQKIKGAIDLIDYSKDWVAGKIFSILVTKNGLYDIDRDTLYYGKTNNLEWNQRGSGIENQEINWMHLSTKFKATLGTNNGIFFSNDTGHVFSKRVYIDNKMTSFNFPGEGQAGFNDYYYTTLGGRFYKNDVLIGYSNIQTLQLAPDGSMFAGTNGFGIFQSSDNGKTWHERNAGLENLDVRDIEFISNGNIFAATRTGAFLSEDKGAS